MNDVSLVGRLTKDPELKFIPGSGTAVCNFTLAVDRGLSKDKEKELKEEGKPTADFIRIVVWGKQGENSAKFLAKGRLVSVSGSIRTSRSENDDGSYNYFTDVNAYNVEYLDWGDDSKSSNKKSEDVNPDDFSSVEDLDDIPF